MLARRSTCLGAICGASIVSYNDRKAFIDCHYRVAREGLSVSSSGWPTQRRWPWQQTSQLPERVLSGKEKKRKKFKKRPDN